MVVAAICVHMEHLERCVTHFTHPGVVVRAAERFSTPSILLVFKSGYSVKSVPVQIFGFVMLILEGSPAIPVDCSRKDVVAGILHLP